MPTTPPTRSPGTGSIAGAAADPPMLELPFGPDEVGRRAYGPDEALGPEESGAASVEGAAGDAAAATAAEAFGEAEDVDATVGGVLRNRRFLALWLAQVASQIGGNMVLFGLTVMVADISGTNTSVSLLLLAFLVPAVIFSAPAGVFVDRLDRRLVLIATNVARGAVFVLLVSWSPTSRPPRRGWPSSTCSSSWSRR